MADGVPPGWVYGVNEPMALFDVPVYHCAVSAMFSAPGRVLKTHQISLSGHVSLYLSIRYKGVLTVNCGKTGTCRRTCDH